MKAYKTMEEIARLFRDTGFTTVEFYENPDKKWISVNGEKIARLLYIEVYLYIESYVRWFEKRLAK
jgi:hypothetical protein